MGDTFRDKRPSRCEIKSPPPDGPKASQNRRVSSAAADTTVRPSGLCIILIKRNEISLLEEYKALDYKLKFLGGQTWESSRILEV